MKYSSSRKNPWRHDTARCATSVAPAIASTAPRDGSGCAGVPLRAPGCIGDNLACGRATLRRSMRDRHAARDGEVAQDRDRILRPVPAALRAPLRRIGRLRRELQNLTPNEETGHAAGYA